MDKVQKTCSFIARISCVSESVQLNYAYSEKLFPSRVSGKWKKTELDGNMVLCSQLHMAYIQMSPTVRSGGEIPPLAESMNNP